MSEVKVFAGSRMVQAHELKGTTQWKWLLLGYADGAARRTARAIDRLVGAMSMARELRSLEELAAQLDTREGEP